MIVFCLRVLVWAVYWFQGWVRGFGGLGFTASELTLRWCRLQLRVSDELLRSCGCRPSLTVQGVGFRFSGLRHASKRTNEHISGACVLESSASSSSQCSSSR